MAEGRPQRSYGEKEEKEEEKERQQLEKQEKHWEEKWQRDPLTAAAWALIIIWGGLVLLAANIGVFEYVRFVEGWPIFFLGAGGILLLEVVIRQLIPEYHQPVRGNMTVAIIFAAIGIGGLVGNWGVVWGLAIVVAGAYLLLSGVFRNRRE